MTVNGSNNWEPCEGIGQKPIGPVEYSAGVCPECRAPRAVEDGKMDYHTVKIIDCGGD